MKKILLIVALLLMTMNAKLLSQTTTDTTKIINLGTVGVQLVDEYKPPFIYQVWWNEVKQCGELQSIPDEYFSHLRWHYVTADAFKAFDDGPFLGLTYPILDNIWIASPYLLSSPVIKHEMLHYLLWQSGRFSSSHPIEFFKCNLMPLDKPQDQ